MSQSEALSSAFIANYLEATLSRANVAKSAPLVVALSGGLDSVALLHLLAHSRFKPRLKAIHVNHGLQAGAAAWVQFCRDLCFGLDIPFEVADVVIEAEAVQRSGMEAAARNARYAALFLRVQTGQLLLTAHHAGDQLETVLFRLERGAGLVGLTGIPGFSKRQGRYLVRPLLGFSKDQLRRYLLAQQQTWVEDPSNADFKYRRNEYRRAYIPQLPENVCKQVLDLVESSTTVEFKLKALSATWLSDRQGLKNAHIGLELELQEDDFLQAQLLRYRLSYWFAALGFSPPATVLAELIRQSKGGTALGHAPSYQTDRYQLYLKRRKFIVKPLTNG